MNLVLERKREGVDKIVRARETIGRDSLTSLAVFNDFGECFYRPL
jgi:hypothetical protein